MSPLLAHCPQNSAFVPQDEANASPWGIHVNIGDKYAHLGVQMLTLGTICQNWGHFASNWGLVLTSGTLCLNWGHFASNWGKIVSNRGNMQESG